MDVPLSALHPERFMYRGDGTGVVLDCPCGCGNRLAIPVTPTFSGCPPLRHPWQRTGELDHLTLSPSVDLPAKKLGANCVGWHGFIRNGVVTNTGKRGGGG